MSTATTVIDELDWDARPTHADVVQDPASSLCVAEAWVAQVTRSLAPSLDEIYISHEEEVAWVFQMIACLDDGLPSVPLAADTADDEREAWYKWESKYLELLGQIAHIRSRMAASSLRGL